jgi:alkanesulfonate monooxygenase SsuD/methylene tetrahydromethanopterin reductase-like flavin-dependent oxidoreductase (luciferase family)
MGSHPGHTGDDRRHPPPAVGRPVRARTRPSTRALVEGFHGVRFAHPADKLRETTIKVRALLAGERALLDATPESRPLRLGQPAAPDLRIWLAAMGDRTVRVAAELADGWFPLFVARDQVLDRVHRLRKDRGAAALRTEPLTVVAGPMTVATDDAAVARRISASCVAWYLSAMGDVYARFVTEQGYGGAVQAILEANPHPRPDGGVVPAEAQVVLDQFTAHGTPSRVRDQLAGWNGSVDVAMIGLPPGLPWVTIEATLLQGHDRPHDEGLLPAWRSDEARRA